MSGVRISLFHFFSSASNAVPGPVIAEVVCIVFLIFQDGYNSGKQNMSRVLNNKFEHTQYFSVFC
jgi:hypothetical protein